MSKISPDLAVVLCGAILTPQKLGIFQFFDFWENTEKSRISQDLAVALRGAMWRYPEPSKVKKCSCFSTFWG